MGEFNNMISVRFKGGNITKEQIEKLLLAKEQITWLDINNSNVSDELLEIMPNFKNEKAINKSPAGSRNKLRTRTAYCPKYYQ